MDRSQVSVSCPEMGMETRAKKQHYVPRLYLESFARGERVCVFDKVTGKVFWSSLRDVACQRYFYDLPDLDRAAGVAQALEKFFHPFEEAAAVVLKRLRASLHGGDFVAITRDQRIDLSIFLALQMLRTPESREHSVQLRLALHREAFLAWLQDREPELAATARESFALEMTEDEQIRTQVRTLLDHEQRDRIAEIIYQHYWVILENPFSSPFITSDHPACNHGTLSHPVRSMQGLASPGAEILFPLSPRYLLLVVEREAFPHAARIDGRLTTLGSPENVVYYNHWQVRHAYRFLYSMDSDFALAQSMLEETPELADPGNERTGVRAVDAER
jgi:hypothetical protein